MSPRGSPPGPPESLEAEFWRALTVEAERLTDPLAGVQTWDKPDFRSFVREGWHVLEPATPFRDNWHLDAITEHLQAVSAGQMRRLVINIPPRHMKSLLVSVFWPMWWWTWEPFKRFLWSSYDGKLSTRDSLKCRRLLESPWYRARWGDRYRLSGDQNLKNRFDNDKTGYRIATSVGGAATGDGGDVVCVDDPHNATDVESDTKRESTIEWWDGTMGTRLNDPKTGAFVVVGQRTHYNDLFGHLLAEGGWEHLNIPAEYEPRRSTVTALGWKDPRTEPGELLWPDRVPRAELEELKRRLGAYRASAQLQQDPSPAQGGIFRTEWWRWYEQPPSRFDKVVLSWDMSFKGEDDSDYVVGQVWGRVGADAYLLDEVRKQLDFPGTVREVLRLVARWPQARAKYVEDKANGPAVVSTLKRRVPGLIAVEPEGDKVARAHAVTYLVEAGNVYLPRHAPWAEEWVEEFRRFPRGAHDDRVDAATQALRQLFSDNRVPTLGAPVRW